MPDAGNAEISDVSGKGLGISKINGVSIQVVLPSFLVHAQEKALADDAMGHLEK